MAKKQPPQEQTIEIRDGAMLKCFLMRFRGYTYEQMVEAIQEDAEVKIKYTIDTLQAYFAIGGRWRDTYEKWRALQITAITEQVQGAFVAQAIQANQQIVKIAGGMLIVEYKNKRGAKIRKSLPLNGKVVLAANQDILDRAGFKPVDRFQATDAEDIAERIMKRYEQAAKQSKKKRS